MEDRLINVCVDAITISKVGVVMIYVCRLNKKVERIMGYKG